LQDIYIQYAIEDNINKINEETKKKELDDIFIRNDNDNFELDKYSEFTVKESLLSKLCSFLLRKKVIIFLATSFISVILYKLFKTKFWFTME